MTRPTVKMLRTIADDIESEFPEHAAYLRTFHVGQSGKRTENGHTAHNIELAKIWCQIDDRIKRGEAEGDVLADVAEKSGKSYDFIGNLWTLDGRPAVRAVLKDPDFRRLRED